MPGFESLFELYDEIILWTDNDSIWAIAENNYQISPSDFRPLDMIRTEYYNEYLNNTEHPFHRTGRQRFN